jgi:lysozyme
MSQGNLDCRPARDHGGGRVTLYGIDVASFQTGLNLAEVKAESLDFIIAKATQGSGYVDPSWTSFRDGAIANDLILIAYH